jgi:hypothetical protein
MGVFLARSASAWTSRRPLKRPQIGHVDEPIRSNFIQIKVEYVTAWSHSPAGRTRHTASEREEIIAVDIAVPVIVAVALRVSLRAAEATRQQEQERL